MKTAVLISGQLRTFKKCYPTQRWQIFRNYEPDIHFFFSVCNDEQGREEIILPAGENLAYANVHVERYDDPVDLPDIPIEKGKHAPYANAAGHHKLMLQHWGNERVWNFFGSKADPWDFDVIIRIRPDLWIHRFIPPRFDDLPNVAFLPWWGKFGGVNDRLAVMNPNAAQSYFGTYDLIETMLSEGAPFHPETLVARSLTKGAVDIRNTLMTEFSTMRMDGSQRWAEIVMSDLAELVASR